MSVPDGRYHDKGDFHDMNDHPFSMNESATRRGFLLSILGASGAGALAASGCASSGMVRRVKAPRDLLKPGAATVNLVTGVNRRQMVRDAMEPFRYELAAAIADKQVIIKINCVGNEGDPLMVTPPDAVRGVLDVLAPIYDRQVIIAESPVQNKNPERTFGIFGYPVLEQEYNARLLDLNYENTTWQWIVDRNLHPTRIRIIDTFLDPDNFFISVTRIKTHNCVVATLTLKNMVMGSPLKLPHLNINDKAKMHAGNKTSHNTNLNLFKIAHRVHPDFSVLDGFVGVEGNGPAEGTPVDHRVALAGFDFVAVDRIGTELMGIPWGDVGYLAYCAEAGLGQGDRDRIRITGENPRDHVIGYKLHENIDWQMQWKRDLDLALTDEDA